MVETLDLGTNVAKTKEMVKHPTPEMLDVQVLEAFMASANELEKVENYFKEPTKACCEVVNGNVERINSIKIDDEKDD